MTKCIAGGQQVCVRVRGQDLPDRQPGLHDLKAHGGHKVALTGEMKDETITVSKIAMPKADKQKKVK